VKRALNRPPPQTVLSLQVRPRSADSLAERIREMWMVEPVQLERPDETAAWLEVYFPTSVEAMLASLALGSNNNVLACSVRGYAPRDWRSFWKHHFKARDIGARLRVCPAWSRRRRRGRVNVVINPGLSFGTGDHFTTRFCLEMIDSLSRPRPPASFLDVGTGSGILAIAAARLGARRVVATDNDEQALDRARANAKLNGLAKTIRWMVSDITTDALPARRFDIVSANLYATLLAGAAPSLTRAAKKHLILSGIREPETEKVADAFLELGAREIVRDGNGEWSGLVFEVMLKTGSRPQPTQG
jgi:ribosomal protein L11 methyltransferase